MLVIYYSMYGHIQLILTINQAKKNNLDLLLKHLQSLVINNFKLYTNAYGSRLSRYIYTHT